MKGTFRANSQWVSESYTYPEPCVLDFVQTTVLTIVEEKNGEIIADEDAAELIRGWTGNLG